MNDMIILAEDDPVQRTMLARLLERKLGYRVVTVADGREAVAEARAADIDALSAVILDIAMPVMDGMEALQRIKQYRPDLPVIMLTAQSDAAMAVKAIKAGAADFIIKPVMPAQLDLVLQNAVRMRRMAQELTRLRRDREGALTFSDLIGHARGLREMVTMGRKAALSDVPILVSGETGTGKELFARAIHGESKRTGAPFVAVNCGAIPENLVESILFGHEKGSFTGAVSRSIGKFREAEGGTIFLDEIGELPLEAQVKLLRALQQKEVEPVGGSGAVKINVRVISATHRDLKADVAAGRFREDLFFRLNVLPMLIPPLRARREDIPELAQHFMHYFAALDFMPMKPLTGDALAYLQACPWEGNVRELENLIRRALVLCEDEAITESFLRSLHGPQAVGAGEASDPLATVSGGVIALCDVSGALKSMAQLEQEIIDHAVGACEGNMTRAAEMLGLAKSTLYRKVKG